MYRHNVIGDFYSLARKLDWASGPPEKIWGNRTVPSVPNPDFFTTLLWQRLMGRTFLESAVGNITADSPLTVSVHVACTASNSGHNTPGSDVTIAFLDVGTATVIV